MPSGKVLSQDAVDMIRYMHEFHKLPYSKIGELIGRPKNYIGRILDKCDPITGERILAKKGRRTKTSEENDQTIRELALANPYIGCDGLAKLYNETAEKKLSRSSVHRRLKHLGINVVKVPATTPELQEKKAFPKSQAVWRFELAPEKKKRISKKKALVAAPEQHQQEIPEALPEPLPAPLEILNASEADIAARTVSILVFSPGMPPIQIQPPGSSLSS